MRKIYFSLFAALLFCVNSMAGDVVTFEEIEVNADGYQNDFGEESCFELGGFTFNSNYFPEWSYWSGFAVSSRTETTFANLTPDQYNSCVGHGVNGSAKYCVVYPQGEEIEVDEAGGTVISGFYVTNEAWAVDAILNGDGMTPGGFTTGDWYKLTVIGTHADETTSSIDVYLADYRSENTADHYYINYWQWVDLTALGQVVSVTFRLDSSRKNDWGMTTPGYFCIDDFNGVAPATVPEGVVTFEEIALNADGYQNDFGEESCFELGGFTFNSNYFPEWSYWSGFAVSSRTETTFANLTPDQYNSCVGHGVNGSAKYCVVYPQGEEIEVDEAGGTVISGFYVTNEAWAVDAILNGDGMTPGGFTTGDWYKLTVIGTHADETTSSIDVYLADYRSENTADHYYINYWQWVDLTALGQVVSVTFRLDSSRKNDWGMTTPGYFCIDDFNGVPDETASIRHHFTAPSTTATSIHTLDGKAISTLQRGINIVRMSDGSVRKVVVK